MGSITEDHGSGRQCPELADTVEKVFLGGRIKILEAVDALIGKRGGSLPAKAPTE
jgi:hypothetical protein